MAVTAGTQTLVEAKVELDGPIGDTLSLGAGLFYKYDEGFFDNAVPAGIGVGSNRTFGARGALRWQPSNGTELYLKALYSDERDGAPPHFLVAANSQPDSRTGFPRYFTGRLPKSGAGFFTNSQHRGVERESIRLSANFDTRLSDAMLLQSLTGYNTERGFYDFDADYTELFFNRTFDQFKKYDVSQDLRLSGDAGSISWLIGGSYYHFHDELLARSHTPGFGGTLPPGALSTQNTTSWAGYGALDFKPVPVLSLRGELRWQREKKTFASALRDQAGQPLSLSAKWNSWLPRFTASWFPYENHLMIYASVARGFKAGGYNTFANLFDNERTYDPETNWTYELGFKAEPVDRLTLNAALFWMDWKNQQVIGLSTRAASNNQYTTNAAASRSRGVELEARYRATDGLAFNLGYAYIDARFRDFDDLDLTFVPLGTDVSGNRIPRTSAHQLTATAQFEGRISETTGWYVRVDGAYQSNQFSTPANLARTGGITNLNGRIGLTQGDFELALWVRNLFDERNPYVGVRWFDATGRYTGLPPFQRAWLITAREGRRGGITLSWRLGR